MRTFIAFLSGLLLWGASVSGATSVSQWGITWTFDKDYPTGQFVNGDHWVVGPVKVIGISTSLHAAGWTPAAGEDGSMVNPGVTAKQGYDSRINSYDASLNAALINGKPIAPENPLELKPNSSLVSMVSWLYKSEKEAEAGIPRFNGGTKAPRPVTRSGALLTVLDKAPAKDAFRPPYAGTDHAVKFTASQLDKSKLLKLDPVAGAPDPAAMAKEMERPWIDHVNQYLGAMVHPSENMPDYGRDMGQIMIQAALLLHVDFDKLPGKPGAAVKDKLLIEFVQYGIDLAGIADAGGDWPANGGHLLGRKWPILFAGVMLNDQHMKDVGKWKTAFQEDEQTFIVTQKEVDLTNSPKWKPDTRGTPAQPYTKEDIGLPEWGIQHANNPEKDDKDLGAVYRDINASVYPGFVLAARLMGQEEAWNHPPLFAYTDRMMETVHDKKGTNTAPEFVRNMWEKYNARYAKKK
jgi:hypothetical protein